MIKMPANIDFTSNFTDDPTQSFTPDAEYYFSTDIFEIERRNIFYRNWVYFCHESQVEKPGDYLVGDVVGQSIYVLRGNDGVVRAFFNVCRHRSHQLLSGNGNLKSVIRCPYHSWTYDLEGNLRNAPKCDDVKNFDKESFSISAVSMETVGGFILVNLDANAQSLDEAAPSFRERFLAMAPESTKLHHAKSQEFEINANWKVIVENFLENYHSFYSGPAHAKLSDVIDQSSYQWDISDKIVQFTGKGGAPDKLPYATAGPRTLFGQDEGFNIVFLWPNTAFITLPGANVLLVFLMNPTSSETTHEPLLYFTFDGEIDAQTRSAVDWFNDKLGPEDVELCESVQRGLHSLGCRPGRLMVDPDCSKEWSEHFLHHFNSLNIAAIKG
ncbi:MAG: aromatic ring-hydroxylating dioxygenase subunit alpha [Rhodospirillaceae bacterium]|nr:aromatic ring-hydroxylating dioxygenase subunit alpha [Rhodospirillaceae bacterium]